MTRSKRLLTSEKTSLRRISTTNTVSLHISPRRSDGLLAYVDRQTRVALEAARMALTPLPGTHIEDHITMLDSASTASPAAPLSPA